MMKSNSFSKSISALLVSAIAVLAFVRGTAQTWCLVGVFASWGIWMLASFLLSKRAVIKEWFEKQFQSPKKENPTRASAPETSTDSLLLRHVNYRISAYLKSVYPDVTWQWRADNPEEIITEGGTGRIQLFGVSDFNYADVVINQSAKIDFEMLCVVPIAELNGNAGKGTASVDLDAWYSVQGKKVIEDCIANLGSQGYATLSISETGDICVRQADKVVPYAALSNLPAKNYWSGFIKLLNKDGLEASIADDCIAVSW